MSVSFLFGCIWILCASAVAQPSQSASTDDAKQTAAGASVASTVRLSLGTNASEMQWLDYRDTAVFSPWIESTPAPTLKAKVAGDLRLHLPPAESEQFASVSDASDPSILQPISVRIRDLWMGTRGEHIDTQMGFQRVTWGVGLGISVIDNFNPYLLENPSRFDQRLSTAAARVLLHHGPISIEGVATPFFVPAALPQTDLAFMMNENDLFDPRCLGGEDVELGELETRASLPATSLQNGTVGARIRWTPPVADLALSWVHGPDSLPQIDGEVVLTGFQTNANLVNVAVPVVFPQRDIVGLEGRTQLPADINAWAELAMVFPDETAATVSENQLAALVQLGTIGAIPDPTPTTVTQDGNPYARWLVGADRFLGPVHAHLQWLHGFPTERQASDIRDYALMGLRWNPVPTIRLGTQGLTDFEGWILASDIGFLHSDALETGLGVTWIDGNEASTLAGFRSASHIRASARISF